jgi:hypothetical protein
LKHELTTELNIFDIFAAAMLRVIKHQYCCRAVENITDCDVKHLAAKLLNTKQKGEESYDWDCLKTVEHE